MRNTEKIFANTSVGDRHRTDSFFRPEGARFNYSGSLDKALNWIEHRHMNNPKMWSIFVEQYVLFSDDDRGWRGEFWGKMMRAAVSVYVYTGDEGLYSTLTDTVEDMLSAQDRHGRFSTYSDAVEYRDWDIWCRKYVMLGLQYYYDICKDECLKTRIAEALKRHTDYLISTIGAEEGKLQITSAGFADLKGINASSVLEPVVRMYFMTKEQRYLDFAKYIIDSGGTKDENIFELAYENEKSPFEYEIKKGYEMISCFEGIVEYYRATGDKKYLVTAENFASKMMQSEITALGGCGCEFEFFDNAAVTQTDPTLTEPKQETCTAVTWMKFCMQLLFLTGKPVYADYMERTARNVIMGALNTEECHFDFEHHPIYLRFKMDNYCHNGINNYGMPFDSYSPTTAGYRGSNIGGFRIFKDGYYRLRYSYYGCCGAIGGVALGIMANTSLLYTEKGITFNDYYPGRVIAETPSGREIEFEVTTEYPAKGRIEIKLLRAQAENMTLGLRIPEWSKTTYVKVCGQEVEVTAGQFADITREWNVGDKIEIDMDMTARVLKQNGFAAIKRGPLVYAIDEAIDGSAEKVYELLENSDSSIDCVVPEFDKDKYLSCITVPLKDGNRLTLCDYSSAGKTWDKEKRIAAWFPVK